MLPSPSTANRGRDRSSSSSPLQSASVLLNSLSRFASKQFNSLVSNSSSSRERKGKYRAISPGRNPSSAFNLSSSSTSITSSSIIPEKATILFIIGCLFWYLSSALSSNTSKALLSSTKIKAIDGSSPPTKLPPIFPYPVTLTLVQFIFVNFFCYVCASKEILGNYRLTTLVKPTWTRIKEVGQLSVFAVLGHATSSLAISRVPVSTVHTIKALSPLFTVLSYTFFFKVQYSIRTYSSLVPLTLGVMMACTGLALSADDILGFLFALGSTGIFVAQNIYSKKLLSSNEKRGRDERKGKKGMYDDGKMDKLNVLFYSSGCSVVLMLPLFAFSDLPSLLFGSHQDPNLSPIRDVTDPNYTSSSLAVLRLLFLNGVVHFAQNLLAFNILGLVSPVTYSIASLFKRVFVICFAIVWFGQSVSRLQWIGIVLTFGGLYMYNSTKTKKEVASNEAVVRRHERESSLSLPTSNRGNDSEDWNLNTSSNLQHLPETSGFGHLHSPTNTSSSYSPRSQTFSQSQSQGPSPARSFSSNHSIHPMFSQPQNLTSSSAKGSGFRDFSSPSGPTNSSLANPPPRKVSSIQTAAGSIQPSGSHSFVKDPRGSLPSPPESGRSSAEDKTVDL